MRMSSVQFNVKDAMASTSGITAVDCGEYVRKPLLKDGVGYWDEIYS